MSSTIIAVEVLSIIILLVLLYGSIFEIKIEKEKNRTYKICIILCIIALMLDSMSYGYDGELRMVGLLRFCNAGTFLLGYAMSVGFNFYMQELIRERRRDHSKWYGIAIAILSIPVLIVSIVGIYNGKTFYFEAGYYTVGPWYLFLQLFPVLVFIYEAVTILLNREYLRKHDIGSMIVLMAFPFLATLIGFVIPGEPFIFVALAITLLTVYVLLQAEQETDFKSRERLLMEISRVDALTGLPNRKAYNEICDNIRKDENVGVIFCDVNGLKYTNDHFGHEAGDKLIVDFAEVLRTNFRQQDVFRISGDEFVIVLPDVSQKTYAERIHKIRAVLNAQDKPVAAVGGSYGGGVRIATLVQEAESKMYTDKEEFYKKYPELRRH